MKELIKITENAGRQIVSARELHQFLEVKSQFIHWAKRMFAYGFTENQDYLLVGQKRPTNNPKNPFTTENDYALTLDAAKQISMIQKNKKGQEARQYFIECEKKLNEGSAVSDMIPATKDQMILEAMRELIFRVEVRDRKINAQDKVIKALQPDAEFAQDVLKSESAFLTTTIAAELQISALKLNAFLADHKVQFHTSDRNWVLFAKYQGRGFTKTRTHKHKKTDGTIATTLVTVWTERGRRFIHELWKAAHEDQGKSLEN